MKNLAAAILGAFIVFGGCTQAGAATTPTVIPVPAAINATCSKDVSHVMATWLANLADDSTVTASPTACYLVDKGLRLTDPHELTITGGTWKDLTKPVKGAPASDLHPVFWFVGGTDVMLTGLTIQGAHTGAYQPAGAFGAGIRSDGVRNLDVQHDTVKNVFGDGIELNALRGAQDDSGTIVAPTRNAWVQFDTITGAGRQGVTIASVNGAYLSSVTLDKIGINDFDLEADQSNEYAKNVTIDGCTTGSTGAGFFANGGAGGSATGNVTVSHCTMTVKNGGDPILIQNIKGAANRGPFLFANDTIRCGSSVYVGCIQITGADVTITDSKLIFPAGTVLPTEYKVSGGGTLTLSGNTLVGKFKPGISS